MGMLEWLIPMKGFCNFVQLACEISCYRRVRLEGDVREGRVRNKLHWLKEEKKFLVCLVSARFAHRRLTGYSFDKTILLKLHWSRLETDRKISFGKNKTNVLPRFRIYKKNQKLSFMKWDVTSETTYFTHFLELYKSWKVVPLSPVIR